MLGDDQTKKTDLLIGHYRALAFLPAGIQIGPPAQIPAQRFEPVTFDIGHRPGKQPGGFNHFSGDNPAAGAVKQSRSRKNHDLPVLGGPVNIFFFFLGDVGQITTENRLVNRLVEGLFPVHIQVLSWRLGGPRPFTNAEFLQNGANLVMDIAPFAHAVVGQKVLPAKAFEPVAAFVGLPDMIVPIPDVQQGGKIGYGIVKLRMRLIGFGRFFQRPFPRILDAQRRGNNRYLIDAPPIFGLEQHA